MSEKLKVLIINGSPRVGGNTSIALREMETVFEQNGVETECVQIGLKPVRGCIACNYCVEHDKCVFDDEVNTLAEKFMSRRRTCACKPRVFCKRKRNARRLPGQAVLQHELRQNDEGRRKRSVRAPRRLLGNI